MLFQRRCIDPYYNPKIKIIRCGSVVFSRRERSQYYKRKPYSSVGRWISIDALRQSQERKTKMQQKNLKTEKVKKE